MKEIITIIIVFSLVVIAMLVRVITMVSVFRVRPMMWVLGVVRWCQLKPKFSKNLVMCWIRFLVITREVKKSTELTTHVREGNRHGYHPMSVEAQRLQNQETQAALKNMVEANLSTQHQMQQLSHALTAVMCQNVSAGAQAVANPQAVSVPPVQEIPPEDPSEFVMVDSQGMPGSSQKTGASSTNPPPGN